MGGVEQLLVAKLDAVATVESASPATGRVVRLTVSGSDVSDLSPNKAVVSLPVLGAEEVDMSSTRGLVAKLCPLARERVVVFARPQETKRYGDDDAAVIVRLTPRLLHSISRMAEVVREEALGYAVRPLDSADFTYRVRYLLAPDEFGSRLRSDLCVSTSEVWVRTHLPEGWSGIPAETEHVPLREILPEGAIPRNIELPTALSEEVIHRYGDRLRAQQDEERVYDVLASAAYRLEGATPFSDAREVALRIEGRLEAWERALEAEGEKLWREILRVRVGDPILTTVRGKTVRMRVNRMHVHGSESGVYFSIYGTRFRKDGTLGKREDMVVLNVDRPKSAQEIARHLPGTSPRYHRPKEGLGHQPQVRRAEYRRRSRGGDRGRAGSSPQAVAAWRDAERANRNGGTEP